MRKTIPLILLIFILVVGFTVYRGSRDNVGIKTIDSYSIDAFSRWRVSEQYTLFDSKQIFDNQPLYWDELLESGAGISSSYTKVEASTHITSTDSTAGVFTRQTFMRFNYQSGKSQYIAMTGVLDDAGGGDGVQRRIGIFDDDNGFFFEDDQGTIKVVIRSSISGSFIDTKTSQSDWNLDKMDGTGPSGINMDFTKAHIWVFDFEWLGVGRSRYGMFHKGILIYVHQINNDNTVHSAYMSTPNLPLRYQMITTGSSPVSVMVAICATVVSEGGVQHNGILRYKSTEGIHVDVNTENTAYAIMGIRLKSTHVGAAVDLVSTSLVEIQGSKFYEWGLVFNPIIAGTFTYTGVTNSAIETASGSTDATLTLFVDNIIGGGFASSAQKGGTVVAEAIETARRLGVDISGVTRDQIVLFVRPIGGTSNLDIEGSITWRELN